MNIKIWIDDIRPAPHGYFHCYSVNQAKTLISLAEFRNDAEYALLFQPSCVIELIDIDHDAGDYACDGGDYIKLLDWFEETGRNYLIRIHSMNPVGVENMRRIIQKNGWKEAQ